MFPITLRPSKSDRSLRKLKKGKSNLSWSTKPTKGLLKPEVNFAAFRSGLPHDEEHVPLQITPSVRRARCISTRNSKRDTILIDLTNNEEFAPALDYAFAILDDDNASTRSLPPTPPPKMPVFSRGSSSSSDMLSTPSTSTFSQRSSINPSARSAPPRYIYVASPLSSSTSSSVPSARTCPQKRSATTIASSRFPPFDPHELSLALAHAQSDSASDLPSCPAEPPSPASVPFPPPAAPVAVRVPLLQRKPRLIHSAESSFDGHSESFVLSRSCPGSSKVSLARSVSSLDHHRDVFGPCLSTTSVNTIDSSLSALLARQPSAPRTPYVSLRLFSSPKKNRPTPARRASTPPPSRARLGIPSARPPVPALPDVFLLGPAARREAVSDSNSLLSRSCR